MVTWIDCPWSAELGESETIAGPVLAWVTVNPLPSVTTSDPVERVTVRAPSAAAGSISSTAVALVAEPIVNEATAIPGPKLAAVVLGIKEGNARGLEWAA